MSNGATPPLIRSYLDIDAAGVAALWNASDDLWPSGFSNGRATTADDVRRDAVTQQRLLTLVATSNENIVGFCSLIPRHGDLTAAYVATLGVHPASQGQGIGRDLLRRAMDVAITLGYARVDLDTWPGNTRAIPLYKHMGFVWVPETNVVMENYIPTLLAQTSIRAFLGAGDWYRCLQQEVALTRDALDVEGRAVYRYRFAHDGRPLVALIDRRSRHLVSLETDQFVIALRVPTSVPLGGVGRAIFELHWRQQVSLQPSSVSVHGRRGLDGGRQAVIMPRLDTVLDVPVSGARIGLSPVVRAEVALPLGDLALEAGVDVQLPLSVELRQAGPILAGAPQLVGLDLRNNLETNLQAEISLVVSQEVTIRPNRLAVTLPPGGSVTLGIQIEASRPGIYELEVDLVAVTSQRPLQPTILLPVPIVADGVAVGYQTDDALVLENTFFQARLFLTGGRLALRDWPTGARTIDDVALGPPFNPGEFAGHVFLGRIESDGTVWRAILIGSSRRFSGVTLRREIEIGAGPLICLRHHLRNTGPIEHEITLELGRLKSWSESRVSRRAIPTQDGVVVGEQGRFPDWEDATVAAGPLAESWIATEEAGRVIGTVWPPAAQASWTDRFGPSLRLGPVVVLRNGDEPLPEVLLYVGPGDWRVVRDLARRVGPVGSTSPDCVTGVLGLRAASAVLLAPGGEGELLADVRSLRRRPQVVITEGFAAPGWEVAITGAGAQSVSLGSPRPITLQARRTSGRPIDWLRLRLRGELDQEDVLMPLIDPGDPSMPVEFNRIGNQQTPTITVDNGSFQARIVPSFGASITSLVAHGDEWLVSPYPDVGCQMMANPWIGGIAPLIAPTGGGAMPPGRAGYLLGENVRIERVGPRALGGLDWHALQLSCLPARLSQLRVDLEYLFLSGSSLLVLIAHVHNAAMSTREFDIGWEASVAACPTGERGWLRWGRETRHMRWGGRLRSELLPGGRWMIAGHGADGEGPGLAIIAGRPLRAIGRDLGAEGMYAAAWGRVILSPQSQTSFTVVVARVSDVAEVEALASWTDEL